MAWVAFAEDQFVISQGEVTTFNSSAAAMRSFCPQCGTGLWYRNAEMLPGIVDVQLATLDDPEAYQPQAQIQTLDRVSWMESLHKLHGFERFPGLSDKFEPH